MYIKLKNPQQNSLQVGLLAACVILVVYIIIIAAGLFIYGSLFAFASALWGLFQKIGNEDYIGMIAVGCVCVGAPIISFLGFWEYFKNRHKWRDPHFIHTLDFQLNDVLLISSQPTVLPYSDTYFKLVIHIKRKRAGKQNYVPTVTQLSLCFDTKEMPKGDFIPDDFKLDEYATSDQFQAKNFQYTPAYQLDHVAKFQDIFPLLDISPRFRQFTYSFYMHDERDDLAKYRDFVDKQIQNHLMYGAHLALSKGQVVGRIMLLFFCLIMLFPSSLFLMESTPIKWFDLVFMGMMLCIFVPIAIFQVFIPLWKQYKAYKILKPFKQK